MKKRMILMLAVVGAVIAVMAIVKTRQIKSSMTQNAAFQKPAEEVTTIVAREEQWAASISEIGKAVAVLGDSVSADLPGIYSSIEF